VHNKPAHLRCESKILPSVLDTPAPAIFPPKSISGFLLPIAPSTAIKKTPEKTLIDFHFKIADRFL